MSVIAGQTVCFETVQINFIVIDETVGALKIKRKGLLTREATKRGRRQFTYLSFIGLSHFLESLQKKWSHGTRQAQNDKCMTFNK